MKGKKCPHCLENALYTRNSEVKNGIGCEVIYCGNCHSYFTGPRTEMDVFIPTAAPQKSAMKEIKNIRERKLDQSKDKSERNI